MTEKPQVPKKKKPKKAKAVSLSVLSPEERERVRAMKKELQALQDKAVQLSKPKPQIRLTRKEIERICKKLSEDGRCVLVHTDRCVLVTSVEKFNEMQVHGKKLGKGELTHIKETPPEDTTKVVAHAA